MVLEWHNSSWNSRFLALGRNGLYWSPKNPFLEEHWAYEHQCCAKAASVLVGNTQQSFIKSGADLLLKGYLDLKKWHKDFVISALQMIHKNWTIQNGKPGNISTGHISLSSPNCPSFPFICTTHDVWCLLNSTGELPGEGKRILSQSLSCHLVFSE